MRNPKSHNGVKVQSQFLKFEKAISLTPLKKERLSKSMLALNAKLNNYLTKIDKLCYFSTQVQGSFKMGTIVVGKDGTYDIDVGIWFLREPNLTPATIKNHIYRALEGHTLGGMIKKDKCLRVIYASEYHVDLPIYYKTKKDKYPFLGTKDRWLPTDPLGFCNWFKKEKAGKPQLVRIVKYFKFWANSKSQKMPSGMAITVWATENYVPHERDDIAFYETTKAMYKQVDKSFECINPTPPNDDLMDRLSINQKIYFLGKLRNLAETAERAIKKMDEQEAIHIWTMIFGKRFSKNNF
ncbi:nucleotidyltransferase [Arcicella rigui]|uniref:Cyclic GMP-AMP synthase n=1 Tax=Arcicella rigui TaxID=797020 RepID=A0ABU5QBF0_9BACT|nr:nucleotidyltransferase [Arcicella rigui]MEA5139967.1 nucleotidyltransferase [Arcicella rigui]